MYMHNIIHTSQQHIDREPMTDHFTVVCLVAWPLNENEAGGVLIEN